MSDAKPAKKQGPLHHWVPPVGHGFKPAPPPPKKD